MSVYACADLHGSLELWNKIKAYLHSDDTLYFLGDAADRGLYGWTIIKDMFNDSRVIYIRGNHEQMIIDTLLHGKPDALQLWRYNGGLATYLDAVDDSEKNKYLSLLNKTPLFETYQSDEHKYYLCHAGCTPPFYKDLLWDRSHFWDNCKNLEDNSIIVHGHTPTYMVKERFDWFSYEEDEATWEYPYTMYYGAMLYANGHKIDLDCGTAHNHCTVLLNLDTLVFIPFREDKINGKK